MKTLQSILSLTLLLAVSVTTVFGQETSKVTLEQDLVLPTGEVIPKGSIVVTEMVAGIETVQYFAPPPADTPNAAPVFIAETKITVDPVKDITRVIVTVAAPVSEGSTEVQFVSTTIETTSSGKVVTTSPPAPVATPPVAIIEEAVVPTAIEDIVVVEIVQVIPTTPNNNVIDNFITELIQNDIIEKDLSSFVTSPAAG